MDFEGHICEIKYQDSRETLGKDNVCCSCKFDFHQTFINAAKVTNIAQNNGYVFLEGLFQLFNENPCLQNNDYEDLKGVIELFSESIDQNVIIPNQDVNILPQDVNIPNQDVNILPTNANAGIA